MSVAGLAAIVGSAIAGALFVLAIAALRQREHARARRLAAFSAVAAASTLPIIVAAALAGALMSTGPEAKATYLAQGISAGMNAGLFDVPIGLASVVVWIAARRREASARR